MLRLTILLRLSLLPLVVAGVVLCQDSTPAAKIPLDHVIGTIKAVDSAARTITVQEDKTNAEHLIRLANTRTILKVEPTAKDLKNATRITAEDLAVGDRVDIRGAKLEDDPATLNARSVILMSGRDLAKTHEEQAAAWAHATVGRVISVDANSGVISAAVRSAGAVQNVTINTSKSTEFTRYSPDSGTADPSQFSQIQIGDRVRVIGNKNADGAAISAEKVYSGAFRTIPATIASIGSDGKSITVKDLANKKEVTVALTADVQIHKLPPMMAAVLARRLNPAAAGAAGGASGSGAGGQAGAGGNWNRANASAASNGGNSASLPGGPAGGQGGAPAGGMSRASGDISQMIDRTPTISLSDLKPGDAVVISGVATSSDNSHLLANTLVAGVEPILQAAPTQRGGGRDLGGDWGLGEISAPQ